MPKNIGNITKFNGGLSNSEKEGQPNSFRWARSIDFRSDARKFSILPRATKESGTVVSDLPLWAERVGTQVFAYGNGGCLYNRDTDGLWTNPHTAPASSGNGLAYFGEDDYLYYSQNTTLGRYGQVNGSNPQWYDNFLSSEGGAPTNPTSLSLVSASSQYADRASTASLQITGDLSLEAYIKPSTLPAAGASMTLVSKWDESGATRSYKLDIDGISNAFGDGSDGALTISANTTDAPIDSACSGTSGTNTLTATNASFVAGQKILIHQSQGTGAGTYQMTSIASYTAGTITTTDPLNYSYSGKAQVIVMKEYTSVTVNAGVTWTAKAWDYASGVGGILTFFCNGTTTVNGTIDAKGSNIHTYGMFSGGFKGSSLIDSVNGYSGEGTVGPIVRQTTPNGNGGGGGQSNWPAERVGGAGGGGNGTAGGNGFNLNGLTNGQGGLTSGSADLTTATFGGGGGATGTGGGTGCGGDGGGFIMIISVDLIVNGTTGSITANGGPGESAGHGAAGGGAGGSICLRCQTCTLNTNRVTAIGGTGGTTPWLASGGAGGDGRIHIDYFTSYTGTSTPAYAVTQDNNLSNGVSYQAKLTISQNGTATESYAKMINLDTTNWTRLSVTWQSATSTATFYQNAVNIGSVTGTYTAISANASRFAIGKYTNSSGNPAGLYNGLIDDVRIWAKVLASSYVLAYLDQVLTGSEANLKAYYQFSSNVNDTTALANNLTASGGPTYSTDVPFSGVTTRNDQDQTASKTGNTYTTPTTISEAATDRLSFVPEKDPQKSIRFYISAIGTGNWTVTIHDALNRTVATATAVNGTLNTGFYEFTYANIFRPNIGATYHAHITSTVADGTVRTQTAGDLTTADYATFYQFLISDSYHPILHFTNFLAIGNERYLATFDGQTYKPHRLTLPSGYRIRCLSTWREYLAIGVWKGTSVKDYEGKIFFWDGTSDTYNYFIDIPEGAVNAIFGTKGLLYIVAGSLGDYMLYQGGDAAQKIRRLPKITKDKFVEVYPGAMDMWQTLSMFGVGNSDSSAIERGIYSWGSLDRSYAESLGYDYPISTGNRNETVKIGMIKPIGQKLLIGWQDNISYGIDVVDPTGAPYATATMESLISDFGQISKTKLPLIVKANFEELPTGATVSLKYKPDRNSSWTNPITVSSGTELRLIVKDRITEFQMAVDLTATTQSPVITGLSLESDSLSGERDI